MKSTKTGKEVVSEIEEVVRGALLTYCHTGLCCLSVDSEMEEGPPPFSGTLVSMTMMRTLPTVDVAASEAVGSQQQPLGADGSLGEEGEGKAQSHWGVVGSSQERSRGERAERGEVGEEGMGSQKAGDVGLLAVPEVPMEGSPSSASLA